MIKTIEIEDTVYAALEERVQGFGEKPNDVIKRLLAGADKQKANPNGKASTERANAEKSRLLKYVESPEYLRGNAKDRYFDVLRSIYEEKPEGFEKLQGFSRGSRIHISKNPKDISESGLNTHPQQLEKTPFWVMTNLSNERKQTVLHDIMEFLGYPEETIAVVVKTITSRFRSGNSLLFGDWSKY